ncbi:MAG: hypothetical protein EXS23_04295 [Pedosphaera sp.]|nr:hypothetical protein [Pedosphaera sp.]
MRALTLWKWVIVMSGVALTFVDFVVRAEAQPVTRRDLVSVGGGLGVKKEETALDAVLVFGEGKVDGIVEGDLVVVAGHMVLNGKVKGDVTVVLGDIQFGPEAEIGGKTTLVLSGSQGANYVDGDSTKFHKVLDLGNMSQLHEYLRRGVLRGRPIVPSSSGSLFFTLSTLLIIGLGGLIFKGTIGAGATVLVDRPVTALCAGLTFLTLSVPLTLILVVSVVGIVLVPFFLCMLVLTVILGNASVYIFLGRQLSRATGIEMLQRPLGAGVVGALTVLVLYMIPVVGCLTLGLVTTMAVGCVMLALLDAYRRETRLAAPAPISQDAPSTLPSIPEPAASIYPRAGFWRRLASMILDLSLIGIVTGMLWGSANFFFLTLMVYHVGMVAWRGTTVGKLVLGLKVVRLDGQPVGVLVALVRGLGAIFSTVMLMLGFLWVAWDVEQQSWHDKMAGTVVVRIPRGLSLVGLR